MRIITRNFQKKIPIYPARIKKPLLKALKNEGVKKGEISVSFVDDRLIAKLNAKYLKKNEPTDVLAFNLSDGPEIFCHCERAAKAEAASEAKQEAISKTRLLRRPAAGGISRNDRRRIPIFGDIIVSVDTARRNCRIYKTSLGYELNLYSLHGLLHLLGYNDNNPGNRKIMRKKELLYVHP